MTNYSARRKAHLYALMAWSDKYTLDQAQKLIQKTAYSKLDSITYAETSIISAYEGVEKYILSDETLVVDKKNQTINPIGRVYGLIIKIIVEIHNKWVKENAKKYDRGSEEKSDKNLFQHLPTALIGLDEVAKDLMFLAPMLEKLGVDVGDMELTAYGKFRPSASFIIAYKKYVKKYNEVHKIATKQDLRNHIMRCVEGGYKSLQPTDKKGEERIAYMQERIDLLVDSVISKNESIYGNLADANKTV